MKTDNRGLDAGTIVGLFVGMGVAITVALYLYSGVIGPTIAQMVDVNNTAYIGAGASPLVSAVTIFYVLGVMILPVVVLMHVLKE